MHWFTAQSRLFVVWGACAAQALSASSSVAQPPAVGPTTSQAMPAATPWPTRPPSRIYVIPFTMDAATAGGRPFFVLDSSDRGRRAPGTLAIGAVAGFNPAIGAGRERHPSRRRAGQAL